MTSWTDYQDDISDAISDSMDVDWSASVGARAVVAWLNENKPLIADTPRVTVPPQALEAIAFNLCSLHDFDVAFVRENERFATAVITEYARTLSAAPAPEGGAVAWACKTCNSPRAVDPCQKCGTALTKPADGWEWPGLPDIDRIRRLAREVGYAVGVHGTMERDLDLIAAPWVAEAVGPDELAQHIADGLGGEVVNGDNQDKPCGRWSCNIHTPDWTKLIDLSVMPPALATREEAPAEAGEAERDADTLMRWANGDLLMTKETIAEIIKRAVPALRAQPPAREDAQPVGWRSIDSAPKDGTVIDVWRADGGKDTVHWGKPHHDCGEAGGYCDSDWHSIRAPGWVCNTFDEFLGRNHNPFTHWKPLEEGPDAAPSPAITHPAPGALRVAVEALERADRVIGWMSDYVGKMSPPADGLLELNQHWLFMQRDLADLQAQQKGGA